MSIGKFCLAYTLISPFTWVAFDKGILQGLMIILWFITLLASLMIFSDFITILVVKDLRDKWKQDD